MISALMLSSVRIDGRIRHETAIIRPYRWKTAYLGAIFCPQSLVCGISGRVDSMCYLHLCLCTLLILILVCIFTVVGADCVIAKCYCVFLLVQKIIE